MRTIHKYILSNFLTTFLLAMLILTFVMTIGILFQSIKFIARGMDAWMLLGTLWRNIPGTLTYSMPIAVLVSSLLVFSRLSSDSEISAMRSCGVPLSHIMRTPVLLATLLSLLCIHINNNVAPDAALSRFAIRKTFKVTDVTALIEPGAWIDVDGIGIFVSHREGDWLYNLRITQTMPDGTLREARAVKATTITDEEGRPFLEMHNVTVDPGNEEYPNRMTGTTWRIPVSALSGNAEEPPVGEPVKIKRRIKDRHTWELLRDLIVARFYPPETHDQRRTLSRASTEVATRTTLALACLCFVLIGIPLGIQNHRRESSAGLSIALVVAGGFYLFCLTGESLAKNPDLNAYWLVLVPVPVSLILSRYFLRKNN